VDEGSSPSPSTNFLTKFLARSIFVVHFNFTVDDLDAENIMSFVQKAKDECLDKIVRLNCERHNASDNRIKVIDSEITWLRNHMDYISELIGKMTNTRV